MSIFNTKYLASTAPLDSYLLVATIVKKLHLFHLSTAIADRYKRRFDRPMIGSSRHADNDAADWCHA